MVYLVYYSIREGKDDKSHNDIAWCREMLCQAGQMTCP